MAELPLSIPHDRIEAFCRKWKIVELSLFGSVLRDDFDDTSDIDVLVAFAGDAEWDYFDWPEMSEELSSIFGGRNIDLVERASVRNPFMRHEILTHRQVLYAA
jgi:uncharacterized protein